MSCSVSPGAVSAKVHQVRFMGAKQLGPTWMRMWRLVAQGRAECTDPFLARLFDTDTVSCHLFELVISKARSVDDYAGMPGDHVTFSFSGPRRQEVQRGHVLSECTREPARGCVSFVAQVIVLESEAGIKQGFEGVVYCHTASVNCKVRRILGSFDKRTGREIEESPRVLRRGQVGLVELAPCNCWPKDRRAGLAASDRQEFCVEPIKEVPGMGRFMMQNHGTKIVGAIRAVHKFASRADELEDSVALSLLKGKASQRMHSWEPEMLFALLRLRSCRPGRYRSPLPSSSLREVCRSAAVTPALRQQLLGFAFALEGVQVFREALPCLPVDDEMSGWLLTAESGLAQLGYTRGHIPPVVVMAALRDPAGLVRLIAAGPDTEALPQALQVADTHFQYKKQHGDYFAMNFCPRVLTAPQRCQIAVCQETIACLELASSGWSPESHHLFPSRFREVVRSVVGSYKLMARAFARQGGLHVSTQLTEMILQHLPRDHGFDYDGIRSKKHIGLWK